MSDHYHDHEQDERDYYDRQSDKHLREIGYQIRFWALLTAILMIAMLIFSCKPAQMPATLSIGTVIQVDGDRVLVTFQVVNKDYSDQAANWFYIPGHSYQRGDTYPDSTKDPNLKKP